MESQGGGAVALLPPPPEFASAYSTIRKSYKTTKKDVLSIIYTLQHSVGIMAAPLFHNDEIRVANFENSCNNLKNH